MAKDHGSSVKNDKQYEGLRKKGMSKKRAAKISNAKAKRELGWEPRWASWRQGFRDAPR